MILPFRPTPPPNVPLPSNITRTFVSTAQGPLELLTATPEHPNPSYPPILFQHGGFGCASVYLEFMTYYSARGYRCYAHSIRGHGHSWSPGYLRFTFFTTAKDLAADTATVVNHVTKINGGEAPILVGHSNGGGLSQLVLDQGMAKAAGLVILAGTPNFGGFGVYLNWWKADKWFMPRLYLRDLWHPKSPLSSPVLVKRIFFCQDYPMERVKVFEKFLSWTEALMWPMLMMGRFVDTRKVLLAARGRVGVLCAEKDALMSPDLMERVRDEYAAERKKLVEEKKLEPAKVNSWYTLVKGSGHHVQNDLQWETAAEQLEGGFKWIMEEK